MTHRFTTAAATATAIAVVLVVAPVRSAYAGVSGSATLASDYSFRGVSQSNQDPALQAGLEYASDGGLYIGTWGSNISWLSDLSTPAAPISSSLELDGYAGYRGRFGERFGYDVGAIYYAYPGDFPSGFNSANTAELYLGVSVGAFAGTTFAAKYAYALTDLFGYADSEGSRYLDLTATWEFVPSWTLNVHGGKQWVANNAAYDYADWKVGVGKSFADGFSAAIAYSDTDADETLYTNPHGRFIADDTVILTLSRTF